MGWPATPISRVLVAKQIMSYDINFWKQERSINLSPEEIYKKLCKRESVEGLARLPVEPILKRLKETFPEFDPSNEITLVRTSKGSIEFSWSDQHFRFDIYGICGDCQKLVEVMNEFHCPMYDPQENKRYDAQDGMTLGETPKFEDTSPEQKAEIERLRVKLFDDLSGELQKKKGCGTSILLCLIGLGGFVAGVVCLYGQGN